MFLPSVLHQSDSGFSLQISQQTPSGPKFQLPSGLFPCPWSVFSLKVTKVVVDSPPPVLLQNSVFADIVRACQLLRPRWRG